jgi:hypothetical protein
VIISPPPETVTEFVTLVGAPQETSTVNVNAGYALMAGNESLRVQFMVAGPGIPPAGMGLQVQPLPEIDRAIKPEGTCSAKLTAPLVDKLPALLTVIV